MGTLKITKARRREIEREAEEERIEGIRRGLTVEAIVERLLRRITDITPLEAWRFANGWARAELSARIDALYESDDLAAPGLDAATLCRWELGDRQPSAERIEYLCRVYRTRPDRLGFGKDHSPGNISHLQRAGIIDAYPYTSEESEEDLIERVSNARRRINLFGLTRNFYARERFLPLLEEKVTQVPINIYVMDPHCDSRKDRYRIEPADAAMEDPERYIRETLRPLYGASQRQPQLRIFTFNFPCSFAIEEVDDVCRVMVYGHGRRGTHAPIILFTEGTSAHSYFAEQIRWLDRLGANDDYEPWASKGIVVRPLEL